MIWIVKRYSSEDCKGVGSKCSKIIVGDFVISTSERCSSADYNRVGGKYSTYLIFVGFSGVVARFEIC